MSHIMILNVDVRRQRKKKNNNENNNKKSNNNNRKDNKEVLLHELASENLKNYLNLDAQAKDA